RRPGPGRGGGGVRAGVQPPGRWRLMGDAAEVFRSKERQAIRAALKGATEPMSIPDIMAAVERTDRDTTKHLLYKMRKDGEVVSERGRYSLAPENPSSSGHRGHRDDFAAPETLFAALALAAVP